MLCPSCGTEAPDDLPECINCGQVLLRHAAPDSGETVEGLERTGFEAPPPAAVEPLQGLESTTIAQDGLPPPDDAPLDIERNQVRSPAGATPSWEGTLPGFDRGREIDDGAQTPVPGEVSVCVWCGAEARGVFCEICGHRRTASERPAREEAKPTEVEAVLCPACF